VTQSLRFRRTQAQQHLRKQLVELGQAETRHGLKEVGKRDGRSVTIAAVITTDRGIIVKLNY